MLGIGFYFDKYESIYVSNFVDDVPFGPTKKILDDKSIQILDYKQNENPVLLYEGSEIVAID